MTQPLIGPPDPVGISSWSTVTSYLRALRGVIFSMWRGKLSCVVEFTLTANAATTVLNYNGLSPQSTVSFDPKTLNASTEKAAGTLYALTANRGNDAWTVTHSNAASTDRTYQVKVIG